MSNRGSRQLVVMSSIVKREAFRGLVLKWCALLFRCFWFSWSGRPLWLTQHYCSRPTRKVPDTSWSGRPVWLTQHYYWFLNRLQFSLPFEQSLQRRHQLSQWNGHSRWGTKMAPCSLLISRGQAWEASWHHHWAYSLKLSLVCLLILWSSYLLGAMPLFILYYSMNSWAKSTHCLTFDISTFVNQGKVALLRLLGNFLTNNLSSSP